MDGGEEIDGNVTAKVMMDVECSGGGHEENVLCLVGLGGIELREDGVHAVGDREVEQPFGECVFPGDGGPGGGVGGRNRADVHIVDKEEGLEDGDVVEAECSKRRFRFIFVVGGGGGS